MARAPGVLAPSLDLVGVVTSYTAGEQAGAQVRQFVVAPKEGRPVPVELRGETVSGVIADGHCVALAVPRDLDKLEDRTQRPLRLKNLTTGGVVTVTRPGLLRQALGVGFFSAKEIWKGVLSALVGAGVVVVGFNQSQDASVAPAAETGAGTLVILELAWLAFSALVFFFTTYRRWRWEGGPLRIWTFLSLALVGGLVILGLWG
jgi:hypothetical protein